MSAENKIHNIMCHCNIYLLVSRFLPIAIFLRRCGPTCQTKTQVQVNCNQIKSTDIATDNPVIISRSLQTVQSRMVIKIFSMQLLQTKRSVRLSGVALTLRVLMVSVLN